ncbi:hypothetical protein BDDG_09953 [Blastomyces dermatitidis ATCC 18188]|uniref:Transmembrane protein n=1 Tax=Ajellomyces dermatitidis (strain ATCC 18188 / CBS 674.68) TaxID=653446 RepID=F2TUT9_AJEDA|nr:hypothetical protein BDDG_09953 [Blastomyces dermatitidis ATCC 18188]
MTDSTSTSFFFPLYLFILPFKKRLFRRFSFLEEGLHVVYLGEQKEDASSRDDDNSGWDILQTQPDQRQIVNESGLATGRRGREFNSTKPSRIFFRRRGKKFGGAMRCGAVRVVQGCLGGERFLQWGNRDHQIRLDSLEFGAREWLVGNAGFSANGWKGNVVPRERERESVCVCVCVVGCEEEKKKMTTEEQIVIPARLLFLFFFFFWWYYVVAVRYR